MNYSGIRLCLTTLSSSFGFSNMRCGDVRPRYVMASATALMYDFHQRLVGSLASEEVIVQLMKTECFPLIYYSLEVCPLNKSDIKALDLRTV